MIEMPCTVAVQGVLFSRAECGNERPKEAISHAVRRVRKKRGCAFLPGLGASPTSRASTPPVGAAWNEISKRIFHSIACRFHFPRAFSAIGSLPDQAQLPCFQHGVHCVVHPQLFIGKGRMGFDGGNAEARHFRNLCVLVALGKQFQHKRLLL